MPLRFAAESVQVADAGGPRPFGASAAGSWPGGSAAIHSGCMGVLSSRACRAGLPTAEVNRRQGRVPAQALAVSSTGASRWLGHPGRPPGAASFRREALPSEPPPDDRRRVGRSRASGDRPAAGASLRSGLAHLLCAGNRSAGPSRSRRSRTRYGEARTRAVVQPIGAPCLRGEAVRRGDSRDRPQPADPAGPAGLARDTDSNGGPAGRFRPVEV